MGPVRSSASPGAASSLQRLEEELRLHQCSTRECIEQYYLDKLKQVGRPRCAHEAPPPDDPELVSPAPGLSTEIPGAQPVRAPERPLPL